MQLTGQPSIRKALTALTVAVLGSTGVAHATGDNRVESSILLYSEVNRVQAAEGIIGFSRMLKGGKLLNARFTFDGLTGASPNGATPSKNIQTFTRPSGSSSYTVKPGDIPLDDTFKDTRFSFDGSLSQPLNRVTTWVFGAHLSTEHDYTSLGVNTGLTRDFNRKNTTLAASVAFSHDIVKPEGGAPTPLSSMNLASDDDNAGEGEDEREGGEGLESGPGKGKDVFDAVLGITQILDRKTVVRLNYSYNRSSGYLNDPYKLLSIVQGSSGSDPGEPVGYIYEGRPDNRNKQAVFAEIRRYLGGHTIDLSYRYFWDNWGITSQTIDVHYRLPLSSGHALQPHFRWYRQAESDFYQSYLLDGSPTPASASADYRLAPFHAITVGLQYLFPIAQDVHLSLGAEYYRQSGDLSPPKSLGVLSRTDIFPNMDAIMIRAGFSRDF